MHSIITALSREGSWSPKVNWESQPASRWTRNRLETPFWACWLIEKRKTGAPPRMYTGPTKQWGPQQAALPGLELGSTQLCRGRGDLCQSDWQRWELLCACIHSWPFIMFQPFHIPVPRSWPQRSGTVRWSFHACYIGGEKRSNDKSTTTNTSTTKATKQLTPKKISR